jgi:hypothetical protein
MVFGGNVRNRPPACCVAYQGGLNDSPRPSPPLRPTHRPDIHFGGLANRSCRASRD